MQTNTEIQGKPTRLIIGTVKSNDGDAALVQFTNGDKRWFYRDSEPQAQFHKMFKVASEVQFRATPVKLTRDGLFNRLTEALQGTTHQPSSQQSVAVVTSGDDNKVAVGIMLKLGESRQVFCTQEGTIAVVFDNGETTAQEDITTLSGFEIIAGAAVRGAVLQKRTA
jgi:hypothetical protein